MERGVPGLVGPDTAVLDGRDVETWSTYDEVHERGDDGALTVYRSEFVDFDLRDPATGEVVAAYSRGDRFLFEQQPDGAPTTVRIVGPDDLTPDAVYTIEAAPGKSLRMGFE